MNKKDTSFTEKVSEGLQRLENLVTTEDTILSVIKEDHKPLKELIQVMKDSEKEASERMRAFEDFAPLLITHAKAEEQALYEFMKSKEELRQHAFEGEAEHTTADQLCEEIERGHDADEILGKIKVLAEAVEHHIKEEEGEIFSDIEKYTTPEVLKGLLAVYVKVQDQMISEGQDDSPHEADLKGKDLTH